MTRRFTASSCDRLWHASCTVVNVEGCRHILRRLPRNGNGLTDKEAKGTLMNTNAAPDQLYGYDVLDHDGGKIGDVDGVWVDDATSQLEFVGVKTGFIMGKTHLIPTENAQMGEGTIQIPFSKAQVQGAPTFGTDDELSPEDEDQIYGYYGMDRSSSSSPTGLAEGAGAAAATGGYGTDATTNAYDTGTTRRDYGTDTSQRDDAAAASDLDTADQNLVLSGEELQVGKRQVEGDRIRLRKVIRTERVTEPIELRREEVEIERVDASGVSVPEDAFQEGTIEVPVMREEAVVGKEAHITGQVKVDKDVQTETQNVGDEVRREDVEVNRGGGDTQGTGVRSSGGYDTTAGKSGTSAYDDTSTGSDTGGKGRGMVDRVKDAVRRDDNR